jgi:hypothetical protein
MNKQITLLSIILATIKLTQANSKLGFVYELVRHGARAPIISEPDGFFTVKSGHLSEIGMRQRFMLGRFNRERYIEHSGLIDSEYNPRQVYIQSTGVDRTLQSSYSEMMGMFPPQVRDIEEEVKQKQEPMLKVR